MMTGTELFTKAREIGHRVHLTGKGGYEMIAAMKELESLSVRRGDMYKAIRSEYRIRKSWTDETAHAAYNALFNAEIVDELQCYC